VGETNDYSSLAGKIIDGETG